GRTVRASTAHVVVGRERASKQRWDAESIEVVAADEDAIDQIRLPRGREVEAGYSRRVRERSVEEIVSPFADLFPDAIGPSTQSRWRTWRVRQNHGEPLRACNRQWPAQQAIRDRENRGIGADTECERQNGCCAHDRSGAEHAHSKTQVVTKAGETRP